MPYTGEMTTPDRSSADGPTPGPTGAAPDDDDDGSAISELLFAVRAGLDRVDPDDLDAEVRAGALVVDIRPVENREAEGTLPGAIAIERIHLEWRLDPTSPHRIAE